MTINNAIHSKPLTNVSYVATNGSDTLGDGSIIRPFLTIGHAVSVAPTSSAIMIAAGSYTESINFAGITQLTIQAIGGTDYGSVFITGTQSFTSTSNHITFIGVAFNNASAAMATINASAHIAFQDCVFNASAATNPAITVTGAITGELVIRDCLITGTVSNAATAFFQLYIIGQQSTACNVTCSNGATLVLNCPNIGLITHSGGVLELNNIAGIQATAGNCITSTAASSASNQLLMFAINLEQSNLTYGSLVKSGTCLYVLANSNYDPTTVLTGTRQNYGVFAQDMGANYTPSNYTAADGSVKGNLSGIDTAIGLKAAKGANSDITSLSGLTTALSGAQGGTGVINTGKTITLGGNLTTSGAFATTFTVTGATTITLPTTGTLVNSAVTTLSSLSSVGTITTGTYSAILQDYTETNTASSQSATYAINLANSNVHSLTLTGNVTLSFSNVPASGCVSVTLMLIQDGTGSRTVTWPGSVIWPNGTAPTLTTTANHVDVIVLMTTNAGTTWRASSVLNYSS